MPLVGSETKAFRSVYFFPLLIVYIMPKEVQRCLSSCLEMTIKLVDEGTFSVSSAIRLRIIIPAGKEMLFFHFVFVL